MNKYEFEFDTPVLFLIFNRPEVTRRVFQEIRKAKPPRLFVAADGPRANQEEDIEKCRETRKIIKDVDWECDVKTLFRAENLGCRKAVSSAIDWFFDHVEEGIILEDDCLPDPAFFRYCQELLEKYRYDNRIMVVSGNNLQFGRKKTAYSYYFSRYTNIWGWATWRRAWDLYSDEMKLWPLIREKNYLEDILENSKAESCWSEIFEKTYQRKIDSWDYVWIFTCWINHGLSVSPNENLVSNIGFGDGATHTKGESIFAEIPAHPMKFPLKHPPCVIPDTQADRFLQKIKYNKRSPAYMKIRKLFSPVVLIIKKIIGKKLLIFIKKT